MGDQINVNELVRALVPLLRDALQPSGEEPSPTATTLGATAIQTTKEFNNFGTVSAVSWGPNASDDPFLTPDQMNSLRNCTFSDDGESLLIQFFEPHFRAMMQLVSQDIGFPIILLNSERHEWTMCPHGGAASKPDGVGLGPELCHIRVSPGDESYQNIGDSNFGRLANWVLRDSIEFVTEWKTGQNFNRGLGEAIKYHRRIMTSFRKDRRVQNSRKTTDLFIGNEAGFLLVRCFEGSARSIFTGNWDSPYSKHAIQTFCNGTLWSRPRDRSWRETLEAACLRFKVKLVPPSEEKDCFLGYGSSGRVFRVENSAGAEMALKVSIGGIDDIRSEVTAYNLFKDGLEYSAATANLVDSYLVPSSGTGAVLFTPIGRSLRNLKSHVVEAVKALRDLHLYAGCAHGDSRRDNAIALPNGKCLWIDFRTLLDTKSLNESERMELFYMDVETFLRSYNVNVPKDMLTPLTNSYYRNGTQSSLKQILALDLVKQVWRGML